MEQNWGQGTKFDPPLVASTERRLRQTIDRELDRVELSRRAGVLAAIDVAEAPRLRSRIGPKADHVVTAALYELIARDGQMPEQFSPRSGGGFWILLPETGFYAVHERLTQLSRQVAEATVDVNGEQVRVTPIIGYATFADAVSAVDLCDRASAALDDAARHLDMEPTKYSRTFATAASEPAAPYCEPMPVTERFWSPLQIGFILSVLLDVPFIAYVLSWHAGFDLTTITYPLLAVALAGTALVIWIASFRVVANSIERLGTGAPSPVSLEPNSGTPYATAIVVAHLPGESATIVDTVTSLLEHDYPGGLQVILAYNALDRLPVEDSLDELATRDARLILLRVEGSASDAERVNAALPHVRGDFVGIFNADNHLQHGSFSRANRWLSDGHEIVRGHRVVRNGEVSWVARLVAVEYEAAQAVGDPGQAGLDGFGVFGGSNAYWRIATLRKIASHRANPPKDIESPMGGVKDPVTIATDPLLLSSELAPTTLRALWKQRIRWAQTGTQTIGSNLGSTSTSKRVAAHERAATRRFRSGWRQSIPWLSLQVVPILGFVVWRDGGFGKLNQLILLFVLLAFFVLSVGVTQGAFAYLLAAPRIKRHRSWFVSYAVHSGVWFGEFKDLVGRVARFRGDLGERRVGATDSETARFILKRPSDKVRPVHFQRSQR